MKKKVVRLTESELKRMIKQIISEQTAPAPVAPVAPSIPTEIPTKGGSRDILKSLIGKTVQAISNGTAVPCIIKGASQTKGNIVYLSVDNKYQPKQCYIKYDMNRDTISFTDIQGQQEEEIMKGDLYNWLKKNVKPFEQAYDFTSQNTNSPMKGGGTAQFQS